MRCYASVHECYKGLKRTVNFVTKDRCLNNSPISCFTSLKTNSITDLALEESFQRSAVDETGDETYKVRDVKSLKSQGL